ncbi:5638_t:CDS:2, partial [Ambispora leptoticha]
TDNPNGKWPMVIGYNAIIGLIYGYTYWERLGGKQLAEKTYQQQIDKLRQEFQELENLKAVILAKEEAVKKEEEMKKQAETLQKAAEIEKNLKESLSQEIEKVNKILQGERKVEQAKVLLAKLEKLPALTPAEQALLSQLYLTPEQLAAIASQAQYLTKEERKEILINFPEFSLPLKLGLINSGLNNLGVNTLEKKQNFVQLNHQIYQEKNNFGLTVQEKENILLTAEQKNDLLKFAVEKVNLTEEQQAELTVIHPDELKSFALNEQQENLLTTLAPLTREDKYSEENFGEVKDTYLPLKTKFLQGEQKILQKATEQLKKQLSQQELQANKQSILDSLLVFAEQ